MGLDPADAFELLNITPSNRSPTKKPREVTLIIGVGQACVTMLARECKGTENELSVPFSRLARPRQNRSSEPRAFPNTYQCWINQKQDL